MRLSIGRIILLHWVLGLAFAHASAVEQPESCARETLGFAAKARIAVARHSLKALLSTRYRFEVSGLEAIREKGSQGVLFLSAHPTRLIEPFVVYERVLAPFAPKFLIDDEAMADPTTARLIQITQAALPVPREGAGRGAVLKASVNQLRNGGNLLVFPAGQVSRDGGEELGENAAVYLIAKRLPHVRFVFVRIVGLYGSRFSYGWEEALAKVERREPRPEFITQDPAERIPSAVPLALRNLLLNGIWFGPRRTVQVEFLEFDDFPRNGSREEINAYVERALRPEGKESPTYRPYHWYETR